MNADDIYKWLSGIIFEHFAVIERGYAPGCRCLGCAGFVIKWENENDEQVVVFGESLKEAVIQGQKMIKDPWSSS